MIPFDFLGGVGAVTGSLLWWSEVGDTELQPTARSDTC